MTETIFSLVLGFFFALAIALVALRAKSLTVSGAVATTIAGTIIFSIGGFGASVILIAFFISASLLSRLPGRVTTSEARGRDWKQVVANGCAPALAMLLLLWKPALRTEATAFFLGAIATATADTWATEIGRRYGGTPRDITRFRKIQSGLSGGVTWIGLLASVAGALFIASLGEVRYPFSALCEFHAIRSLPAIAIAGFVGALADSIMGSVMQAKYRCQTCGRISESRQDLTCHGVPILISGMSFMRNNAVNLVTTLIGGFAAIWFLDALQ